MVYLDYAATTPLDPRVRECLVDALDRYQANPASRHYPSGSAAAAAVAESREKVGQAVGSPPRDVVFTSGASEALTLGIVGACLDLPPTRRRVLIAATEHKAAHEAARLAARLSDVDVELIPVDVDGVPEIGRVEGLLAEGVGLVVAMLLNNETGVVAPVLEISQRAHAVGALVMCDITQAVGKLPVRFDEYEADMLALSGHKFYGPKGTGALVARDTVRRSLVSLMPGGGQEGGLRGGTPNVPGIVGMGVAAELATKEAAHDGARLGVLGGRMSALLHEGIPGLRRLGRQGQRIDSVISVHIPGADSDEVLHALVSTEVSAGSACSSGVPAPSHVLTAMGMTSQEAGECLRISLGRFTTETEVEKAAVDIVRAVGVVRTRHGWEGVA